MIAILEREGELVTVMHEESIARKISMRLS
jgi:hypothetical protein